MRLPAASLFLFRLLALASGLLLAGCEGPGPFRATPQLMVPPKPGNYRIGFIEFDDQGWFWMADRNRAQVLAVQKMITDAAGMDSGHAKTGIILIAFVHGWENNADPAQAGNNAASFQSTLADVAANEARLNGPRARPVVGVYIAWPGLSLKVPYLQFGTFYSRKNAGDRVGSYGGVTEVLSRLEALSDLINHRLDKSALPSFYAVVGHSFGGQVVFDSLLGIMTDRVARLRAQTFVDTHRLGEAAAGVRSEQLVPQALPGGRRRIQPFGDLVVLINPAFEAERYYNLVSLSKEIDYGDSQRPILVIFGSKTDRPNQLAFPLGRLFSTLFQRYRTEEQVKQPTGDFQRETGRHTIPWVSEFVTHDLKTLAEYGKDHPQPPPVFRGWNSQSRVGPVYFGPAADAVMERTGQERWTPFYVVTVEPSLMDGHNDIWRPQFMSFLSAFILSTNPKAAGDSATATREQNALQ